MSHLVQVPSIPSAREPHARRNHLPDGASEWAVTVDFDPPVTMRRSDLLESFSAEWFEANRRPQLYGFSPEDSRWASMRLRGTPETCTRLRVTWPLHTYYEEEPRPPGVEEWPLSPGRWSRRLEVAPGWPAGRAPTFVGWSPGPRRRRPTTGPGGVWHPRPTGSRGELGTHGQLASGRPGAPTSVGWARPASGGGR